MDTKDYICDVSHWSETKPTVSATLRREDNQPLSTGYILPKSEAGEIVFWPDSQENWDSLIDLTSFVQLSQSDVYRVVSSCYCHEGAWHIHLQVE